MEQFIEGLIFEGLTVFSGQSKIGKSWFVLQLAICITIRLGISSENVNEGTTEGKTVRAILGNLQGIAGNIAELRNPFGSGHGKSASYKGLTVRHAKLAVGSSITLVNYLWDTYEWKQKSKIG